MNWYLEALKKYAEFSGRSRRMEYWMFFLFNFIIAIALAIVDVILGTTGILGGLYGLAVLIPGITVSVRRLHDTDHSGWWLLIGLVPVIGLIVLLVFMVMSGNAGENRFGSDPKEASV